MKLSRICMLIAAAVIVGTIPACKKESGKIKVAIVTNNPEDFWKICESGAQKAAADFDVELIFRMPDNGDVGNQMKIVKALTEQGVAGIAVSVIDPKEQAAELKQIAGKTKLVTMDNDADGSDRICYVGTDNYAAGREVGRLVKEVMPNGGDIAIFVGLISPINARQRFQGVVDELAGTGQKDVKGEDANRKVGDKEIFFRKFGKYYLYNGEAITDKANKENALANSKNALEILGDRDDVCMVGLWAYNPPKILEAIASKGFTKTKVVGFDEDELTLSGIEQGKMFATVVQDPYNFGYRSVEILAAEAHNDQSKRTIPAIAFRVVTQNGGPSKTIDGVEVKNIRATDFRDQLKKLLGR